MENEIENIKLPPLTKRLDKRLKEVVEGIELVSRINPELMGNAVGNKRVDFEKSFRPLADRVLVKKNKLSETSSGGIVISSETATPMLIQGSVVRCGSKCQEDIKTKTTVIFSRYAGVSIDDTDLVILKEAEIMGILKGKSDV